MTIQYKLDKASNNNYEMKHSMTKSTLQNEAKKLSIPQQRRHPYYPSVKQVQGDCLFKRRKKIVNNMTICN